MSELGIDICSKCKKTISKEEIGYCGSCIDGFNETEHLTDYYTLFELNRYADNRREEIQRFLHNENYFLEYLKVSELVNQQFGDNIYTILSPDLAASLDYSLVRQIRHVFPIDEKRLKWYQNYWFEKYEIDVPETKYEVGLVFHGESYYSGMPYISIYDYPVSLTQGFFRRKLKL